MTQLRPRRQRGKVMGPTRKALAEFDRLTAPCTSRATFEDGVHECACPAGHVERDQMHENAAKDHRWSIETDDDGEPLTGMVKR